jgi:hypothetical protein
MKKRLIVLTLITASSPALAQDRDTLWTKIIAEERVVSLSWDKDHPWDAQLTKAGATLMVKYLAAPQREVAEAIGSATVRPGDTRVVRFRLPESISGNPIGPVCLFVQLPDRRTLPIRRANAQLSDTAGFRYDAWDRVLRQRTQARAAEATLASAERALSVSSQSITNQEASVASRGWTTARACDAIPEPALAARAKPFDAVSPAEQSEAAQRSCIRQVWLANNVNSNYVDATLPKALDRLRELRDVVEAQKALRGAFDAPFIGAGTSDLPALLDAILERLGKDNGTVAARRQQLDAFRNDWNRWAPTSKAYRPQIGNASDYLRWNSTALEISFRIFVPGVAKALNASWAIEGVPAATVRDLESFLGASLDAYNGCIEDAGKQLRTKWETWQKELASAPQFAKSAREFLVRECRQEVGLLDKLRAEQVALQQELARAQQALATTTNAPALSSKALTLNTLACGQQ